MLLDSRVNAAVGLQNGLPGPHKGGWVLCCLPALLTGSTAVLLSD